MADLVQQITGLLEQDQPALIAAIADAEEALAALESGKRAWTEPDRTKLATAPTPLRHGERSSPRTATPEPAPQRREVRTTKPLRAAWDLFRSKLEPHIRRKRELVLPLCLRILKKDRRHLTAVRTTLQQMTGEHEEIRELLTAMRREARQVPPVRNEMERVARLLEAHVRLEETEIYPGVFGDDTLVPGGTPIPAEARTGSDVARSLRTRRPELEEQAPAPAPEGIFDRLKRLFLS